MLPCAILCGGLATRLGSVTERVPKSLIQIRGEPFIAHQLRLLESRGVRDVVLCVGHLGEQINDYVGEGSKFGMNVSYSFDGPKLLGTAGAIRKALPLLAPAFFVLYGDSYLRCDYRAIADAFLESGRRGLMTIYRNNGVYDRSNIEASNGIILAYDKRNPTPAMRYIDYGLGVFDRSVFEELMPEEAMDLADIYQRLLEAGGLSSYEVRERFFEVGSVQGVEDLSKFLASGEGM